MGGSSFTFADVFPSQEMPHWISGHVNAVEYFGACPELWVCDNLKTGITRPCRYEPDIHRTYEEFAAYHGGAVLPARVRKPRDKRSRHVPLRLLRLKWRQGHDDASHWQVQEGGRNLAWSEDGRLLTIPPSPDWPVIRGEPAPTDAQDERWSRAIEAPARAVRDLREAHALATPPADLVPF